MAFRSEIERALNDLISDEAGMKFQGLAAINARQKWPQLVACERKWDGGLDAHASGHLQPYGKGIGLASSVTGELAKVKKGAREVKKHYPDVQILIFATPEKVSQHMKELWTNEILGEFGLQLEVVSREEFVTWLMEPANAPICRDQLGIAPSMPPDLEPALERARQAAREIADNWESDFRLAGRPVIGLYAVKRKENGYPIEVVTIESLSATLSESQRIIGAPDPCRDEWCACARKTPDGSPRFDDRCVVHRTD